MYGAQHAAVLNTPRQAFGARVKQLRTEKGFTQEELADRVGVFRTYMSRIETGVGNPTLDMIHALADTLGVPVASLFEPAVIEPDTRVRSSAGASRGPGQSALSAREKLLFMCLRMHR